MDHFEEFDEKLKERARTEPFPLPEDYAGRVFRTCAALEDTAPKRRPFRWAAWAAAALALFITVPNVSPTAAAAMADIPVLGAIVRVVTPGLCGEKAGLKTGDIITKIDDTEVASGNDLITAKNNYKPGDKVTLTVYRSGETLTLELTLEESTPDKEAKQEEAQKAYEEEQQQQQQQQTQQQGSSGWPFGIY